MTKKIIAFQGSAGANSNLACTTFYPEYNSKSFLTFEDVFTAVINGEVDCGMIPLENSSAGRVSEIYDLLKNSEVAVISEHFVKIEHNLAILPEAELEDLEEVYSHPQALMQCRHNLQKLKLKPCGFSNTADAAKFISSKNDKSRGAICSNLAAEINGLKIIKSDIQDLECNATIFIVIAKKALEIVYQESSPITFLMFQVKNYSGSLYESLGSFAKNNVDMMQIESFIRGGASKQATFFVIIAGDIKQEHVSLALKDLQEHASNIKIFGSYGADKSRMT